MNAVGNVGKIAGTSAESAYEDLWRRTLSRIPGDLNRLIYLASTRDYNSGRYHHAGLEAHFGFEAVHQALERAHREVFSKITHSSLKDVVSGLEQYISNCGESPEDVMRSWRRLQPYRVAIPINSDPIAAHLLMSNLKLGLEVLERRRARAQDRP